MVNDVAFAQIAELAVVVNVGSGLTVIKPELTLALSQPPIKREA